MGGGGPQAAGACAQAASLLVFAQRLVSVPFLFSFEVSVFGSVCRMLLSVNRRGYSSICES